MFASSLGAQGVLECTFASHFRSWCRLGAKMATRTIYDRFVVDVGSTFDRFWIDVGLFLLSMFPDFWFMFRRCLVHF